MKVSLILILFNFLQWDEDFNSFEISITALMPFQFPLLCKWIQFLVGIQVTFIHSCLNPNEQDQEEQCLDVKFLADRQTPGHCPSNQNGRLSLRNQDRYVRCQNRELSLDGDMNRGEEAEVLIILI